MAKFAFQAPVIKTTSTPEQQLVTLRSWLFQLTGQLEYTLNNLDDDNFVQSVSSEASTTAEKEKVETEFNSLKSLIIKTADYVKSEIDRVELELNSSYVAKSEFGTYTETAQSQIEANATGITQLYTLESAIQAMLSTTNANFENYVINTSQYIKTGLLYYDGAVPRYGVAVGENLTTIVVDGVTVVERKNLLATFTSDKLSFWHNDVEVAYISNQKLYITNAHILGNLTLGEFLFDTSDGLAIK